MVSVERVRHRIGRIEVDEKTTSNDHVHIDFYVDGMVRWYLSFDIKHRTYETQINALNTRMIVALKLDRYLWEIVPPEIKARCMAASLGVSHAE